jgi:nuclear pore complex protein Nup205
VVANCFTALIRTVRGCVSNLHRNKIGKITVADIEYSINEDFQQGALQLADALNIDELEAAVMFLAAQDDSQVLDRSPLITAIMRFHERRHFLLECLRLIFREALEAEGPENIQPIMQETMALVLDTKNRQMQNASLFARKVLGSMGDVETWLSLLGDQVQKASIVGQEEDRDIMEAIEYQRHSLQQQHESLGAILLYLFKGTFTSAEDFRLLIAHLKKLDRLDGLLIHYFPVAIASFVRHGSPESSGTRAEARGLHDVIAKAADGQTWKLPNFHAAITALWLAIYSGWYFDDGPSDPVPNVDPEKEAEERTKMFMVSLDDGALELMLAICASVNSEEWADPARSELVALLLKESPINLPDSSSCSGYMKELLMQSFEVFVESCIANMPDAVRKLKSEEDNQRLDQITALRDGLTSSTNRGLVEARTHLESLLMIISFAFEHREDAAQEFWGDVEGNLYGFLQWASKRQTVPRVSAFCEMLCSISEGEENAAAAHRFLTEEDKFLTSKLKRSTNMNWIQMFAELHLYATRVTEKSPASGQTSHTAQGLLRARKPGPVDMSEPESPVMLTCYLRLMGHLCKQSGAIREWMLQNQSFKVAEELLMLCKGPIPSHLRATIFTTLSALMTDRTPGHGNDMWESINTFLISAPAGETSTLMKAPAHSNQSLWYEQQALQKIGESFDQTNAFVVLINSLVTPTSDLSEKPLSLTYPESLGAAYRMPGIEPYVDFILGHALSRRIQDLSGYQSRLLTFNCLEFVVTTLRTFNEDLVTVLSQPSLAESAAKASNLEAYVRLHAFSRVMEWLFNEDVLKALFAISQLDISEVAQASSDSVLVLTLLRSVEVMNLIMDLQSTYFNVVKPMVKSKSVGHRSTVANSSLASFEDSVLNNLSLVPALCLYCGTGHEQLTVTSMALLEKLTSSRKLNKMSTFEITKWQSSNKIVEVLATEVDVDSVARSLVAMMDPDLRELECGPRAAGYVIRESLLALLNSCLGMITDRPTVAHLLLGFSCLGNILDVPADGLFANRMSLLHAIIGFLQAYPDELDGTITSYTVHLKRMAFEVLKHLWSSKLAFYFTLTEMRAHGFLMNMFAGQPIIGPNTPWNGHPIFTDEFWVTDATSALAEFLLYRSHLFAYAATEIRSAAKVGSPTLQAGILSTLLGSSTLDNGESVSNASVFDLFDFADLDVSRNFQVPRLIFLNNIGIEDCASQERDTLVLYDISKVEELIHIRKSELLATFPGRPHAEEQFDTEAEGLKIFILATNQSRQISYNRYLALRSWAELVTTITTCSVLDDATRPTFILHAIQMILPKLEISIESESLEAIELARLGETLISKLASDLPEAPTSRSGDVIDEKLHQLFQVSVRGIMLASGNVSLREVLYSICSHYITRITSSDIAHESLRRHSQQIVKTAGPGLVEAVCDDAYTGQEACRASALLFLNCLAALDSRTDCVLAELISQSNYLSLFLDAIRSLPVELRNAQAAGMFFSSPKSCAKTAHHHVADTSSLLAYYESLLALLQQLSQTKSGATYVLKCGLFDSVRESQLFAADPDIGIGWSSSTHFCFLIPLLT